jgi:predicted RecB family nuclease
LQSDISTPTGLCRSSSGPLPNKEWAACFLWYTTSMEGTSKLTDEHFYKFFQCPHWIWYDIYADSSKRREVSPLLNIIQRGKMHDGAARIGAHKQFEELKPEQYADLEEAYLATLNLMRQGKNIYHGVLMTEDWVGMPDLLEARPGKSSLGDWSYVVYDVQRNLDLKDDQKFPLVFYSLILEKIQGTRPREAFVIDPEGHERPFLVDDFMGQFNTTREQIEQILAGQKPPPFLKSGCKRTPWYSLCLEGAEGCNDVSLVYRLSQADQRRLYGLSIHTVSELAAADADTLRAQLEDWPYDKIVRLQNQAQVLMAGTPRVLRHADLPTAATEIYFDIESDPTRDVDYLLGILTRDVASGKVTYESLVAEQPEQEKMIWDQFLDRLATWDDFVVYHYAYYERMVFDRLALRHGASATLTAKFHHHAIDLHAKTIESVVLPLYFYTLKDVAQYIGYRWHNPNAGGAESVVWYDQWLTTKDRTHLNDIIRYNEDDVRATLQLRDWLATLKPSKTRERLEEEN